MDLAYAGNLDSRAARHAMLASRRTLLRLTAASCLAGALPALAQSALDDVLAKKVLTVAIPTDSAPYGYVGTDLQPQGLDIYMANLIAAVPAWLAARTHPATILRSE